jgi:hypothetical protein
MSFEIGINIFHQKWPAIRDLDGGKA